MTLVTPQIRLLLLVGLLFTNWNRVISEDSISSTRVKSDNEATRPDAEDTLGGARLWTAIT